MATTPRSVGVDIVVPNDHPAFAGHFPSRPLLPGAVLLSEIMEALDSHPALKAALGPTPQIDQAKFMSPVEPGDHLHVALDEALQGTRPASTPAAPGAPIHIDFTVTCGEQVVAKGRLSGAAKDAEA